MTGFEDRAYQAHAVDRVFDAWEGGSAATLLVLPCGCGKTFIAGCVAARAGAMQGGTGLFLAHRDTLIDQAVATFRAMGLVVDVEKADRRARLMADLLGRSPDVIVGSIQTMQGQRLDSWPEDAWSHITIDEFHHSAAPSYRAILGRFAGTPTLGITATADPLEGTGVFDSLAWEYPLHQAIADGYLVPPAIVTCLTDVDLKDIRTTGGDLNLGDLAAAIGPHVEELVDETLKHLADRQTVVFTPDVGSAQAFAQVLRARGTSAKYVSGAGSRFGMDQAERTAVLAEFHRGGFQVIVSCDLLFEGWNCPEVSAVVIARPTKKRYRWAQMVGRGLRPCPAIDKRDCLIVDFDWKQEGKSRELVSPVELFSGRGSDPDVLDTARARYQAARADRERAGAGPVDLTRLLQDAAELVHVHRKFLIPLTGKTSSCRVVLGSPMAFAIGIGVELHTGRDLVSPRYARATGVWQATASQLQYLDQLGLPQAGRMGLSRAGASKLIERLVARRADHLATPGQLDGLARRGVDPDLARCLTGTQATLALREIDAVMHPARHSGETNIAFDSMCATNEPRSR